MKRIRMWLRELTLTQQLIAIIFVFLVGLAAFFFLFLGPRIDEFTYSQMYSVLYSSQQGVVRFIEKNPGLIPQNDANDETIIDAIYDPRSDIFYFINQNEFGESFQQEVRRKAQIESVGTVEYRFVQQPEEPAAGSAPLAYLYILTHLSDGRFLVSAMEDSLRVQFQNELFSKVVGINILFVMVLFLLLMVWVTSLILPLNQIKTYIDKIREDDPGAKLNIRRNDEIGAVAYALKEMESELAEQNREKEEMIQNISHDLKTPIATIRSYSEAIKDGIYPYETLEKSVDVIIEHADRLEKKVRSLIVLNKMGYLLDSEETGDNLKMSEVIDKAILSLKVIRPEIRFIREADDTVYFHGEEEPWRIVIENLIDNALRYAVSYIRITLKPGELCIINDGPLIDEDAVGKIFKPYEKGTDGQFGLGLSIVYKVCTTYGYHVTAENLSEGVCFRIWKDLPKRERRRKEKNSQKNGSASKE